MDFADQLAAFRTRAPDPGCRALIILGTRQPITAALLIGALPVERVAFLLTDETGSLPAQVAALLDRHADDWLCPPGDHSTTLRVYEGVKAVLTAWPDLECAQIAVDVTGGLKPMSVGLEKAAHLLGLKTLYIESDYRLSPDGKSAPVPGSQRLIIPPNPYVVFGDLEAAEARRLFHAHDYMSAQRMFADLVRRVPMPDGLTYATYADLARAYAAWDAFDLPLAEQVLVGLVATPIPPLLDGNRICAQAAALQTLVMVARHAAGRGQEALRTLASVPQVLPLLGSLYANARRREDQGRYDTAALLRYRCLELISQHRLARWGVLSEQPDFGLVLAQIPDFERRYERVVRGQGRRRFYGLPDRAFGLFVGYMLLAALDDDLVCDYPIAQIEQRTAARNASILAHGYRLITQADYAQFAGVVDDVLDRFFVVSNADRQAWEQMFRFVRVA
ncbi:MAG: TIGR02710 family CRISPR-associated protein [Oscillochloris sp.]|nr:TIGR02710 family CRISPR-associated protein [Oscillochloris sp.]